MGTIERVREMKADKQRKRNAREKVFWLWWVWIYCKEL